MTFTAPRSIENVIEQSRKILEEGTFEAFSGSWRRMSPAPRRRTSGSSPVADSPVRSGATAIHDETASRGNRHPRGTGRFLGWSFVDRHAPIQCPQHERAGCFEWICRVAVCHFYSPAKGFFSLSREPRNEYERHTVTAVSLHQQRARSKSPEMLVITSTFDYRRDRSGVAATGVRGRTHCALKVAFQMLPRCSCTLKNKLFCASAMS